jgi:ATP-dependent exoDNAse (exonuclease V) beta subunit
MSNAVAVESGLAKVASLWSRTRGRGASASLWAALQRSDDSETMLKFLREKCLELQSSAIRGTVDFMETAMGTIAPWKDAPALLEEAHSRVSVHDDSPSAGGDVDVAVMTLGGAKGLEADVVCVLGLEDGEVPGGATGEELAEKARLIYVAMTRAKEALHLFNARTRPGDVSWRARGAGALPRSRFVDTIPASAYDPVWVPAGQ